MIGRLDNEFQVSESKVPDLSNKKIYSLVRAIVNYEVIEKTKSYTMLRIKYMAVIPSKRIF